MGLKKRLTAVGILALAAGLTFGIAKSGMEITKKEEKPVFSAGKETLYLWYTDEALTSYLSSAAVTYNETHDVRIVPVLESGLEYLENINQASLSANEPDMYILSHDSLEKAYLAGLAEEIKPQGRLLPEEAYMETGLSAVTYKDKLIGYPFYFETSSLLYNKTYLEEMAVKQLEAEADAREAEQAQQELAEEGPEEETQDVSEKTAPEKATAQDAADKTASEQAAGAEAQAAAQG